jgi:hypothetical protein
MSLLSVVRAVCANVGVAIPTSVFSGISANRTMQEMLAHANEMAQRIAYDTRDWRALHTYVELTGDGVREDHPLPNNYKRMLLTSQVYRASTPSSPLRFIATPEEWLHRRLEQRFDSGEWIILNDAIAVLPILANGDKIWFSCLDKNCVALASGGYGEEFQADLDRFRLDERLLRLGMIWQWKANKGSPYAEDMGTYSDALLNVLGRDSPSPIIVGKTRYVAEGP